ncbi:MAG: DUF1361 domain-containing protein [Chitinophagaceae bacterium]
MLTMYRQHRNLFVGLTILIVLLGCSMLFHHNFHFGFLFWNILLAILPLLISSKIVATKRRAYRYFFAALWLLLFPNAAYLVTDITHLQSSAGSGYWLDLVILFSAALFGISVAAKSLHQMEIWYRSFLSPRLSFALSIVLLLLNGYGIYLGRVERWNTLTRPMITDTKNQKRIMEDSRQ